MVGATVLSRMAYKLEHHPEYLPDVQHVYDFIVKFEKLQNKHLLFFNKNLIPNDRFTSYKILHVDDDPVMRMMTKLR